MTSGKMYRFRADSSIALPDFLHYFLLSPSAQIAIDRMKTGTSESGLNLTHARFSALDVPVPSLVEQHLIVEILDDHLSRLDAAVEALQRSRRLIDQFRQALLSAAFDGRLTSQIGDHGADWSLKTLNDLVSKKSDIVDGPFGSNLKTEHYVESGARVLRLQNIGYGSFIEGDSFIALDHFERLAKHNVAAGDLLFASLGTNLPRTCLAPDFEEPTIVKADCIRVRLDPSVNRRFVLLATMRPQAKAWAEDALHGLGRPRLGLGAIRSFPVPWPSREEQDEIVERVDRCLEQADLAGGVVETQIERARALRRALLGSALCGDLTREWRERHG